jgi:hypothetical protein
MEVLSISETIEVPYLVFVVLSFFGLIKIIEVVKERITHI